MPRLMDDQLSALSYAVEVRAFTTGAGEVSQMRERTVPLCGCGDEA